MWSKFQTQAYNLTETEIKRLTRQVFRSYSDAKLDIDSQLQKVYLNILSGVDPKEYYNEMIKFDRLTNLQKSITQSYNKYAIKAGQDIKAASELGFSNMYYRSMFGMSWIAPEMTFGIAPADLIELTVYGTQGSWKNIKKSTIKKFGDASNYRPRSRTLTNTLLKNKRKDIEALRDTLSSGFSQGKSYRSMTKNIGNILGRTLRKDGKIKITGSKGRAMTIIRTEGNRTMNAGRYAQSKYAESVGVDIVRMIASVLDDRTRVQSASMDGQRRGVDEPFTYPDGSESIYPGMTGVARYDINDRERVVDLANGNEPSTRIGRNPVSGKNEVFTYRDFDTWANDNNLRYNTKGKLVKINA